MIHEACKRGVLTRQLPLLRKEYARKRDVMERALHREIGDLVSWPKPRGGFFLWLTLPRGIDADRMLERAVEHGVIYVAGEAFFVNAVDDQGTDGKNTMRLCFSAPNLSHSEAPSSAPGEWKPNSACAPA